MSVGVIWGRSPRGVGRNPAGIRDLQYSYRNPLTPFENCKNITGIKSPHSIQYQNTYFVLSKHLLIISIASSTVSFFVLNANIAIRITNRLLMIEELRKTEPSWCILLINCLFFLSVSDLNGYQK